jgi:uncharacterized coiled-coil protein SlyX
MDIVGNLSAAIALAKRLREISSNIEAAEFKNVLADLTSELADAKLEAASIKEKLAALMEENQILQQQMETARTAEGSPPSGLKWGLYQWNGDQGLFCTACWDARKQKSRVTRVNKAGVMWMCPVCKATFGR